MNIFFAGLEQNLQEIQTLTESRKHYPGMHNQANYGNRFGRATSTSSYANMDDDARRDTLVDLYKSWTNNLTAAQKSAIKTSTGNEYKTINEILRGEEKETSYYNTITKNATEGLKKGSLSIPITVSRGMAMFSDDLTSYLDQMEKNVGKVFSDPAFTSTTSDNVIAGNYPGQVKMKIHLPKGMNGGYVDHFSSHSGENEFLLPPHTKYKVLKVTRNEEGASYVELAALKPGKSSEKKSLALFLDEKESFDSLFDFLHKHYPGQHNQANHGNRYGSASGTAKDFSNLSSDDRHKLMSKSYKDWIATLSASETTAIRTYTGSSYTEINDILRDPQNTSEFTKNSYQHYIDDATAGLNKASAPMAISVTRGMSLHGNTSETYIEEMKNNIGKVFTDPAFVSTTINEIPGFGSSSSAHGIRLKIHIPKGAKGAYVDDISLNEGEHEFLFPPNTRFKVLGVYTDSQTSIRHVELAVQKPGKTKKEIDWTDFWQMKHYPGQHNQANHGNRYGSANQSNGLAQFADKPEDDYSEKVKKMLARDQFMKGQFQTWSDGLTKKEHASVKYYSGPGFSNVNKNLRAGEAPSTFIKGKINSLDSALDKTSSPFAFTVKRGMNMYGTKGNDFINELTKNVGKTFTDAGFISTSTDKDFGGNITLTIRVPKGAKGAYIADISQHSTEHEYLIPRNAKFKVYSVKKDAYGNHQVELGYIKLGKAKKE